MFSVSLMEYKVLLRKRRNLAILFLVPAFFMLLVGLILDLRREKADWMKIPVVDQDKGEISSQVIRRLTGVEGFNLELVTPENKGFTRDQAEDMIRRGERQIAIVFPENFSSEIRTSGIINAVIILDPGIPTGQAGPIVGSIRSMMELVARTYLMIHQTSLVEDTEKTGLESPRVTSVSSSPTPTEETDPPGEKKNSDKDESTRINIVSYTLQDSLSLKIPSTAQQTVIGLIVIWVFFISFFLVNTIQREKNDGTWNRLRVAPVFGLKYIIALCAPYFLVVLGQILVMFLVGLFFINITVKMIPSIILISLTLAAAATSYGIFAASWSGNHYRKLWINLAVILGMAGLGGCIVPSYQMGQIFQKVSHIFPHSWAMEAYLQSLLNPTSHHVIVIPILALLGYSILFTGLAYARLDL